MCVSDQEMREYRFRQAQKGFCPRGKWCAWNHNIVGVKAKSNVGKNAGVKGAKGGGIRIIRK